MPLSFICVFDYGACGFYRVFEIFLCSVLMYVYDIPMSC
jgi:hypothetical protein